MAHLNRVKKNEAKEGHSGKHTWPKKLPCARDDKTRIYRNQRSTISAHRNPTICLCNLVPNRIKMLSNKKGQSITYILTRPCMTFFRLFRSEKLVSVVTCKVKRVFSMEGYFNKINKFIFYQIMRYSSVKSRTIICRQNGHLVISSFKFI